ncbi:hypothetical protein CPB86DRAFT_872882 [Serendipita vermifera]|nr:hypothetical protein CPB86DRAFT_872882 [Serendipita vermifera]
MGHMRQKRGFLSPFQRPPSVIADTAIRMAENKNESQTKTLTAAQKWDIVFKLSIVLLLFGLFVTQAAIAANIPKFNSQIDSRLAKLNSDNAAHFEKFYNLFSSNSFYWNIQWGRSSTLNIATQYPDTVRFESAS